MKKNPFEKFGIEKSEIESKPKEIDKSIIFEALNKNTSGVMGFDKTGKEIKDQIMNIVIPDLKANYDEQIAEIEEIIPKIGTPPTEDFCCYRIKVDMPYKKYNWDEVNLPVIVSDENPLDSIEEKTEENISYGKPAIFMNFANPDIEDSEEMSTDFNYPIDLDQSKARGVYNQLLNCLYDLLIDVQTCNILLGNLKDDSLYNLTIEQSAVLSF